MTLPFFNIISPVHPCFSPVLTGRRIPFLVLKSSILIPFLSSVLSFLMSRNISRYYGTNFHSSKNITTFLKYKTIVHKLVLNLFPIITPLYSILSIKSIIIGLIFYLRLALSTLFGLQCDYYETFSYRWFRLYWF